MYLPNAVVNRPENSGFVYTFARRKGHETFTVKKSQAKASAYSLLQGARQSNRKPEARKQRAGQ